MQTCADRNILVNALLNGHTVITPNNRLSRQLLDRSIEQKSVITKPCCLPYQTFLSQCLQRAEHEYPNEPHPILLTPQHEGLLWQLILKQQDGIPQNDGLLHEIQRTWKHCQYWQLDIHHPAFSQTPQTELFQEIYQTFEAYLHAHQVITSSQLATYLLNYPKSLPQTPILWACFDEFTPQQETLQTWIDEQNQEQIRYDLEKRSSQVRQYAANDEQNEMLQLSAWLKQQLNTSKKNIAVIVPDLQARSTQLQRHLQRYIPVEQFNVSLGKTLLEFPLITHALTWLTLDKQRLTHQQIQLLLRSAYIRGSKTEFHARAVLLENPTLMQEDKLPWALVLKIAQEKTPLLGSLLNGLSSYPNQASPQDWSKHFLTRLSELGFPGEFSMDSETYQCYERFLGMFDELSQITLLKETLTQQEALSSIQQLAKQSVFQPKRPNKPIQILGLLEASGCEFDAIWVCGLTDQTLPQKVQLSAFIPSTLQKEYNMPRSLPEREWELAEKILVRLCNGSHETILSYPKLTGDLPNSPSPLIEHWPSLNSFPLQTQTESKLVSYEENDQIPYQVNETLHGGTSLLANQALCPFRAFAAHRLHAQRGPSLSTGPNDAERGQLIHRILEKLWKTLGNQKNLLAYSKKALTQLVETLVNEALVPLANDRPVSFSLPVQTIEKERLAELVQVSLDWEKKRPAFDVKATEQAYSIKLSNLDINVRIDRLDELQSGEKWVIDYKTSLPINKPWNQTRPEAPQLLLYALLDPTITTLLFLQLKQGQITASGISEQDQAVQGIKALKNDDTWHEKQQIWREQLNTLAKELEYGYCVAKPQHETTCKRCEFIDLCRIAQ